MIIGHRKPRTPLEIRKAAEAAIAATPRVVENLLRTTRRLPKVEANGESDCPFAEKLYLEKQEAERSVIQHQSTLQECLGDVEQQVARCGNNLVVISAGQTALHQDELKREFTHAEASQATEYHHFVSLREQLQQAIASVEQALAESLPQQYPGGARPEWWGLTGPRGVTSGDEVEHLLALGPVQKKELSSAVRDMVDGERG